LSKKTIYLSQAKESKMQPFSAAVLTALIPAFLNLATASPAPTSASGKPTKHVTLIPGDATIQTSGPVIGAREVENDLEKRYAPGRCGLHITQYGADPYGIDVIIKDNEGSSIGNLLRTNFNNNPINIDSQLPYVLVVTEGGAKDWNLYFAYGADSWSSADDRCKVGGWDGNNRQMDCGWAC
jgi:hypothetical protein